MCKQLKQCDICGATSDEKPIQKVADMFLCPKHKAQWYRYGRIIDATKQTTHDKNEIIIDSDVAYVKISDKRNIETKTAIIDAEDAERVSKHKWRIEEGYAVTGNRSNRVRMHRFLLDYDGDLEVDHINRNTLDNRKSNLRIVPRVLNIHNRTYTKDNVVRMNKNSWRVEIMRFGRRYMFGPFHTEDEALKVRNDFVNLIQSNEYELAAKFEDEKHVSTHLISKDRHSKTFKTIEELFDEQTDDWFRLQKKKTVA